MHKQRKSQEQIEITAYIVKHRPRDEKNINEVKSDIKFIKEALEERKKVVRYYGAKENKTDEYLKKEFNRLSQVLELLENPS